MILHYIPKHSLRQHWDYVKNGLEIVRSKGHPEWIIEDVYCDCYENRSMLFIGIFDNKKVGFIVLQPIGQAMHIWAAWHSENNEEIFNQAWNEVQEIAKQGGKKEITFTSSRKGWERKVKQMNFKPTTWKFIL